MTLPKLKIDDFCKTGSGGTPSRKNADYYKGQIPWVKSGDLRENIIYDTEEYISEDAVLNSSAKMVSKGAILLAMYGATVGRMARLGVDATTNQAVCHIIPDPKKADTEYLYYALLNQVPQFLAQAVGGAQPNINQGIIKNTEIYLPDLSTQTQIAKILDKSTALITKRKAQIAELDGLVQSVFLEMFGDPITNPKKLPKVELSDLGIWKSGGTPSRANKAFFTGNIPWITSGELETLYIEDSKEHISEEAVQESSVKKIEIGSILLGMYDTAGLKSSITSEVVTCNQAIAFAKLDDDKVNTIFVYYCIQQQKAHLLKQQRGVRQKNFNLSMIKEIKVLYPNLNLQTQFAQIVEKIQTQKSQLQQSLAELEMQHQALMQRAFRGELV